MKLFIILTLLIFTAQAEIGTPIITHDKIPIEMNYTKILGNQIDQSWQLKIFPTPYSYGEGSITVNYPQYLKSFTVWRNGKAVPGAFLIKYDRFEGTEYLMFHIYLYWSLQSGENSWFIAKSYGENNEVDFYESHPVSTETLDPHVPTNLGGPLIWRLTLLEMEPQIENLYGLFFDCLKERTRQALYNATGTPIENPGNLDQFCSNINK